VSKVKKVLDNYVNPQTKRNITISLTQFFESVYGKNNSDSLDEIAEKYFSEERNYKEDIQNFLQNLTGLAPLTIKLKISNVKTFLLENDMELPQKFWKKMQRRMRARGSRALTLDRIPTNKELKKILLHVPIHGKALFLLLESSGLRIGEAIKSNIDDLYLEEEPARIQIRGEITKTRNSRHAFLSREAKETLTEWLKVREEYLKAAVAKSHLYEKNLDDPRIFPFDPATAYMMWRKALHKAGLNGKDKQTGREKIHPYVLRKFFRTRLGSIIPVDVVEALMGHEGYLTEVYGRYSLEDLRKFYLKGESALLVFTHAQEVTKLRQEVDERNKNLQTIVNGLTAENLEMNSKMARVELENLGMKKTMQELAVKMNAVIEKLEKLTEA
jgi:integrase